MFELVVISEPIDYASVPMRTLASAIGLAIVEDPTAFSDTKALMLGQIYKNDSFSSFAGYWFTFDPKTGKYLGSIAIPFVNGNLVALSLGGMIQTRLKRLMFNFGFVGFVTSQLLAVSYPTGALSDYKIYPGDYSDTYLGSFVVPMVDEINDILMDRSGHFSGGKELDVYRMSTKELLHSIPMPSLITATALEDEDRAYVLCDNFTIVLVDYVRQEILGIGKLPVPPGGSISQGGVVTSLGAGTAITWDTRTRRLLIFQKAPDNPDGTCNSRLYAYRMVNAPNRITKPVPLKYPRKGRIIPMLTQVVGDLNEGIGGNTIQASITGTGSLVNSTAITDPNGRAITQVSCTDAGSITLDVSAN